MGHCVSVDTGSALSRRRSSASGRANADSFCDVSLASSTRRRSKIAASTARRSSASASENDSSTTATATTTTATESSSVTSTPRSSLVGEEPPVRGISTATDSGYEDESEPDGLPDSDNVNKKEKDSREEQQQQKEDEEKQQLPIEAPPDEFLDVTTEQHDHTSPFDDHCVSAERMLTLPSFSLDDEIRRSSGGTMMGAAAAAAASSSRSRTRGDIVLLGLGSSMTSASGATARGGRSPTAVRFSRFATILEDLMEEDSGNQDDDELSSQCSSSTTSSYASSGTSKRIVVVTCASKSHRSQRARKPKKQQQFKAMQQQQQQPSPTLLTYSNGICLAIPPQMLGVDEVGEATDGTTTTTTAKDDDEDEIEVQAEEVLVKTRERLSLAVGLAEMSTDSSIFIPQ